MTQTADAAQAAGAAQPAPAAPAAPAAQPAAAVQPAPAGRAAREAVSRPTAAAEEAENLQEAHYGEDVDYRRGSPHLAHWRLYDRLVRVLQDSVGGLSTAGLPPTVLEIGAGHGGYTEPALAAGCSVTAVEMSRPSLRRLERKYGGNPGFRSHYDPDGSLAHVDGGFSLVLCVSVLHHIPDYLGFVDSLMDRLAPGGSFLSLQDPLLYSRIPRTTHLVDRGGYYAWRLGQGDLRRGLSTVGRRLRGVYDETNPSDMVEYHVIRDGVDQSALASRMTGRFDQVTVLPYWSNQSATLQRVGEWLGIRNTFGIVASGLRD